ncbi:hypothetical protein BD770DRAFT_430411 [Pilaira anomala]|nr:hypothetical protein BD770DRAFT_430411 [Pilaira anomala]
MQRHLEMIRPAKRLRLFFFWKSSQSIRNLHKDSTQAWNATFLLKPEKVIRLVVCKHFGNYRTGRKKGDESKDSVISRPSRNTMLIGCRGFVYVRLVTKSLDQDWVIKNNHRYDHSHPISSDVRTYVSDRKLDAHDQEYAIQILRDGNTPGQILKARN